MATIPGTSSNDPLVGTTGDDAFIGSAGNDTITGNGGADVIDYGGRTGFPGIPGPINATFGSSAYAGTVVKGGSSSGTDTFTGIRGVYGTAANDTLTGSSDQTVGLPYAVILRGGGGNDTIDGLKSTLNQASYISATAGVQLYLQTSTDGSGNWLGVAYDGQGGVDTLRNVERARGSSFGDTINGSAAADYFDATTGSDTYNGGDGFNTVSYADITGPVTATFGNPAAGLFGFGNATVQKPANETDALYNVNEVRGTVANDVLNGTTALYSWNTVFLRGGAGNDTINGQNNANNFADYRGAVAAVTVDLAAGTAYDSQGGVDTLVNVVSVRSSNFNDALSGGAGNDRFTVSASGNHTVDGRGGSDNRVNYDGTDNVTINLGSTTLAPGGYGGYVGSITKTGGSDTLYNLTGARGGSGNDTIIGTPLNDVLSGAQGSNQLDGGAGNDTYRAAGYSGTAPTHGATVNLGDGVNGTATNSWDGTDTLRNIEWAVGSQFADDITGASLAGGAVSYVNGEGGNDTLRAPSTSVNVAADYSTGISGVNVNLATGVTSDDGFFGGQDTLVNIHAARGSSFNDVFTSGALNDTIDGGGSRDVVTYSVASTQASWVRSGTGYTVTAAGLGTDTLTNVEVLRFTDGDVSIGAVRNDANGDRQGDLFWQNASGLPSVWSMSGGAVAAYSNYQNPGSSWRLKGSGDLNADGRADLLWQNQDGTPSAWLVGDGGTITQYSNFGNPGTSWTLVGGGDVNGDGKADAIWQNANGAVSAWLMDGVTPTAYFNAPVNPGPSWRLAGTADLNGDGRADFVFQNGDGSVSAWLMGGRVAAPTVAAYVTFANPGATWTLSTFGDLNGDGRDDLVFQNRDGTPSAWLMAAGGNSVQQYAGFANPGSSWRLADTADANGDGRADLVFQNTNGLPSLWLLGAGGTTVDSYPVLNNPGADWRLV